MGTGTNVWRYVQDGIALLLGTAGFINEVFLKDKPDSALVLICLGAVIGTGVRAGATLRSQAAAVDTTQQSSGSQSQSPHSSSSPSP